MTNLIIACGALASEIQQIKKINNLTFDITCLNSNLHNYPQKIPQKVEETILKNRDKYKKIFIAYADCGTGGELDKIIKKYQVERLAGAHCYQVFAKDVFDKFAEEAVGTFYLTDFLAKNFQRLVVKDLGLLETPELKGVYFKNYKKLIYLIQNESKCYREQAKQAANFLNLDYYEFITGYGHLEESLECFTNCNSVLDKISCKQFPLLKKP